MMKNGDHRQKRRIMIIEDEMEVGAVIRDQLEDSGYQAVHVISTRLANLELDRQRPDAVILDLQLEGENGLDYLPVLKKQIPNAPVLILTGRGYDSQSIEAALQNGAAAYFSKESGIENVPHMIDRLLNPTPLA